MYRILLAEDEKSLRDALKLNLELEDMEVVTAENGNIALKKFEEGHYDLLILDVMMPELDGFAVCEHIRLKNNDVPIMFLTAKDSGEDKIQGLKKGADDYLTKPFNLEEFLLRVKSLTKRSQRNLKGGIIEKFTFDGNEIDFSNYKAKGNLGTFDLTKKETALLKLLVDRKNEVVSRNDILHLVWGYDVYPSTRTIDNFILNFRKNFEQDPKNPVYFISIRSIGYKFEWHDK
ncbi:MAG: response regulator transcription factor [Chitinophagales bacterium]|nr:response regulator transcription factor [Chitinophagales bacterium]